MSANVLSHALCLHFHQPRGNLLLLAEDAVPGGRAEGLRIIRSHERVIRYAMKYRGAARLNVVMTNTLIEQYRDPATVEAWRRDVDLPGILDAWRGAEGVELIAAGRDRAPLPIIPREDWRDQLRLERDALEAGLGRAPKGFWPSGEMFSPEMIPALIAAGYEYVVLGADRLARRGGGPIDAYAPGFLSHGGSTIAVVPFDRGVSVQLTGGLSVAAFADTARTFMGAMPRADRPRLITTWSDAETEEFRRSDEGEAFFGVFYSPYMEFCQTGEYPLRPALLSEYLAAHAPTEELQVLNSVDLVGSVDSFDADRWRTDAARRSRIARVFQVSGRYRRLARAGAGHGERAGSLDVAHTMILEAEAGDNLLWGEEWLGKTDRALDVVDALLDAAERDAETAVTAEAPVPDPRVPEVPDPAPVAAPASIAPPRVEPERSFPNTAPQGPSAISLAEPSEAPGPIVVTETELPSPVLEPAEGSIPADPVPETPPETPVPPAVAAVPVVPVVETPKPVVEPAPVPTPRAAPVKKTPPRAAAKSPVAKSPVVQPVKPTVAKAAPVAAKPVPAVEPAPATPAARGSKATKPAGKSARKPPRGAA